MKKRSAILLLILSMMFLGNIIDYPATSSLKRVAKEGTIESGKPESKWVYTGSDGRLVYKTTPAGDKIMDFSYAGYMGGGVAFPNVPVMKTVKPSGRMDDTNLIQSAIDEVASMPLKDGFRGAVLLTPGIFTCSRTISISVSGVVLRGSGSGINNESSKTTIRMVGDKHRAIVIGSERGRSDENSQPTGLQTKIRDEYVPSGAMNFTAANATGFSVGDVIEIRKPITEAWIKFMQMHNLVRDGNLQTWIAELRSGITERKITAISGNKLTINIPLSDSYDAKYLNPPGTTIIKVNPEPRITQVGVEHLQIQCAPLEIAYGQAPYSAIHVGGDDCWVKDIYCDETMNSTVLSGKRITIQQVIVKHTFSNLGASKPTDFSIEGSQILIDRCKVTGDNEYFVWTGSLYPGPNVILNSTFNGHSSRIQPHQRWSTGMLIDNCKVPDGGIDYPNRGVAGSGHGWTMGWGVVWNCQAKTFIIQNPPGSVNWAIGCTGLRMQTARYFDTNQIIPEGVFESHEKPVEPQSLYLAQLNERLGKQALIDIGYSTNVEREFIDESLHRLPGLLADVDEVLGTDLALHRPVNTSNVRGNTRKFGGERALDANDKTYWATDDDVTNASFEVDTEGPLDINSLVIVEASGMENRIQEYKVEGQVDSDWKLLSQGTTIGKRKVDRFPMITLWKVRLTILKSNRYPAISKFGLYLDKSPN